METVRPDWVLVSRTVIPIPGETPSRAACIAVTDGRITRVAPLDDLAGITGADTRVFDVGDRPVLPGFIDPHAHVEVACRMRYATVDARAPRCGSVPDVIDVLADGRKDKVFGGWLIAQANLFFDQKLRERRLPTREELDLVDRDTAIALRAGGHISVLNTEALRRLGIDERYTPPSGTITGKPLVERGPDGRPTGVVREMDRLIPRPRLDAAALGDALSEGTRDLFTRNGVTSIGEISETPEGVASIATLTGNGRLDPRFAMYL
jgi:predicted amidohydrolase YtcJ